MAEHGAIFSPRCTGTDTEWVIRELEARGTILVDRRPGHQGEGLLFAPFNTADELVDQLQSIYPDWETLLEIIHVGKQRNDELMAS